MACLSEMVENFCAGATSAPSTRASSFAVGTGHASPDHAMVTPPSTTMVCPVMKLPAWDAQHDRSAGNLIRLADATQRRLFVSVFQHLRIIPKRARKIGADQARRDAIDPHVVRSELDGEIARQLQVGRFRDE